MVVFLSYSHDNRDEAGRLAEAVAKLGVELLWDSGVKKPGDSLKPGDSIPNWVETALSRTDNFICLLSPSYVASPYCKRELHATIHRSVSSGGRPRIVPVLLESCEVPFVIGDLLYLDARGGIGEISFLRNLKDAVRPATGTPSLHLEQNLRWLFGDQMSTGVDDGGWGKSNPIFFGLTHPSRVQKVRTASVTQSFWVLQALRSVRSRSGATPSRLEAEHRADAFVTAKVEHWQRGKYDRAELADGRHIAASLLCLQRSPLLSSEASQHTRLEKKMAAYALLSRLVSSFQAATHEQLGASERNLTAAAYMVWALSEAADYLIEFGSNVSAPGSCWDLSDAGYLSRYMIADYATKILTSRLWSDSSDLHDCLNPELQRFLTLYILASAATTWPAAWDNDMREVTQLLSTRLGEALQNISKDPGGLCRLHPRGPGDLATTYAYGLCSLALTQIVSGPEDELSVEALRLTTQRFLEPQLQALSGSLTWSLGVLLECHTDSPSRADICNIARDAYVEVRFSDDAARHLRGSCRFGHSSTNPLSPLFSGNLTRVFPWGTSDLLMQFQAMPLIDPDRHVWYADAERAVRRNLKLDTSKNGTGVGTRLLVLTGPSCCGKSTIAAQLALIPQFSPLVRWQTLPPEGKDRSESIEADSGTFVVSSEQFTARSKSSGFMFEYEVDGVLYGYCREPTGTPVHGNCVLMISAGADLTRLRSLLVRLRSEELIPMIAVLRLDLRVLEERLVARYGTASKIKRHREQAAGFYAQAELLDYPIAWVNTSGQLKESLQDLLHALPRIEFDALRSLTGDPEL